MTISYRDMNDSYEMKMRKGKEGRRKKEGRVGIDLNYQVCKYLYICVNLTQPVYHLSMFPMQ
jgi:hypothetical protein